MVRLSPDASTDFDGTTLHPCERTSADELSMDEERNTDEMSTALVPVNDTMKSFS